MNIPRLALEVPDSNTGRVLLHMMQDQIDRYGFCSLGDYYDIRECRCLPTPKRNFTETLFGWTNLDGAGIESTEYSLVKLLKLPGVK